MAEPQFMTVAEVAEWLKVKPSWVYANARKLGAIPVGKYLRFLAPTVLENLQKPLGPTVNGPTERRVPNQAEPESLK